MRPAPPRAGSSAAAGADSHADYEWLNEFEPGFANGNRGVINLGAAAQVSERLAPRLRTPEANAAWAAATDDPFLHRVRLHGLELPLTGGEWPAAHDAGGNSIKPEYMTWAREAAFWTRTARRSPSPTGLPSRRTAWAGATS